MNSQARPIISTKISTMIPSHAMDAYTKKKITYSKYTELSLTVIKGYYTIESDPKLTFH